MTISLTLKELLIDLTYLSYYSGLLNVVMITVNSCNRREIYARLRLDGKEQERKKEALDEAGRRAARDVDNVVSS